jgi:iron complex outermembrane receptor protein
VAAKAHLIIENQYRVNSPCFFVKTILSSYAKYNFKTNEYVRASKKTKLHIRGTHMKLNSTSKYVALALGLSITGHSIAQENSDEIKSDGIFEKIQVTATKRTKSIQDVPVSVSALSGEQLDALGLSDNAQITQQIPNFQVNAWSPQITIFNLRGVSQNNFVDNLEAPIAVYQDEAYVSSMNAISGQMFDIERVEVLRGPQGTLFGRNATGGLVHYISRGADDEYTTGYLDASVGSYNRQSLEGAIGGAITENVRGRVAFRHETADGYIKPMTDGPESIDQRAIGGADGYGIRATLEADLSDTLLAEFIFKFSKDDDVPTGGYVFENCDFDADELCPVDASGRAIVTEGVVSGDPHVHMSDTRGFLNRETTSTTLKLTKEFDDMELVSITNYLNMDKSYLEDGDAFPLPIVVFGQDMDLTQFSQELRLSGNTDTLEWQFGGYYMDVEMDADALTIGAPNIDISFSLFDAGIISAPTVFDDNPFDGRSDREYNLTVENMSIFGQIDYALAQDLTLTAGLRYSKDTKEIDWVAFFSSDQQTTAIPYAATSSNINSSNPNLFNVFEDDEINYSDYAARLSLSYDFSKDTLGFVAWNRGIKGGNWTLSSGVSPDRFVHEPEVLNSFEVGIKTELTKDTRLNATTYYYDYTDYQTFVAIPPGEVSPNPQIGNSDATAYGAEFELVSSVTDNLDVLLGVAFSHSEVEKIQAGAAPVLNAEFPNAPGVSGNYLIRYYTELGENEIVLQFDGAYYGDQFLEVTNGPGTVQEAYNISNLSIAYQTENWTISLASNNVFDKIYKAYSLDLGALGATTYYAPPRTTSLSAKYQF